MFRVVARRPAFTSLFVSQSATRVLSLSTSALPIGVFVDLDNVSPSRHGRDDAKDFAEPLKEFAAAAGQLKTFRAFANRSTQTFRSEEEQSRDFDQEWNAWDGSTACTGHDQEGVLRCGVCGARMKLTKQDRKRGLTEADKLARHMKTLHDREQARRNARHTTSKKGRPPGGRLMEKDREKSRKYKSAQIGLSQLGLKGHKQTNELFSVLKEQGLRCYSCDDVDSTLQAQALEWMTRQPKREDCEARGCIVVVSEDSDFRSLLQFSKACNFLTVSATTKSAEQTKALVTASDMVLTLTEEASQQESNPSFGQLVLKAQTGDGIVFMIDMRVEEHEEGD